MKYPSILALHPTPLERALEQAAAFLLDIPTPLRSIWSPDDCPVELLPWLAWGLSLDNWSSDWSEDIKRARVRMAIPIARRKGAAAAVRDVVESFGGQVAIREWWQQSPRAAPFTFDLVLNLDREGAPASAAFVDQVIAEVYRAKPARSHFTFTQGIRASGQIGLIAVARPAIYARLSLDAAPVPPPLSLAHSDGSYFADGSGYAQPGLD